MLRRIYPKPCARFSITSKKLMLGAGIREDADVHRSSTSRCGIPKVANKEACRGRIISWKVGIMPFKEAHRIIILPSIHCGAKARRSTTASQFRSSIRRPRLDSPHEKIRGPEPKNRQGTENRRGNLIDIIGVAEKESLKHWSPNS